MNEEKLTWRTYEFDFKEKTGDWFWAVGIITVAVATISVIYNNILFAIFTVIAGAMIAHNGKREPNFLKIKIDTKGLYINDLLYPYQNIKTFWVEENKWGPPKLILRIDRLVNPIMVIAVETDEVDAETVRNYLLSFVVEEKIHEPISQRIMEYFGF